MKGFTRKIKIIWELKKDIAKFIGGMLFMVLLGFFSTGDAIGGWLGFIAYHLIAFRTQNRDRINRLWEDMTEYDFRLLCEIRNQNNKDDKSKNVDQ